jgi:hypothetical protein
VVVSVSKRVDVRKDSPLPRSAQGRAQERREEDESDVSPPLLKKVPVPMGAEAHHVSVTRCEVVEDHRTVHRHGRRGRDGGVTVA